MGDYNREKQHKDIYGAQRTQYQGNQLSEAVHLLLFLKGFKAFLFKRPPEDSFKSSNVSPAVTAADGIYGRVGYGLQVAASKGGREDVPCAALSSTAGGAVDVPGSLLSSPAEPLHPRQLQSWEGSTPACRHRRGAE